MTKALKYILLGILLIGSPIGMMADELFDGPESEVSPVTMSVSEKTIHICGANGETLYVYNLAGVFVSKYRVDSSDKTIELNLSHGCYIFKVGKVVRKFSIK